MSEFTTINISKSYKNELKKLAKAWGKPQKTFIEECIYFFKISNMNPANVENFSPKTAMEKLTKKVESTIGFFINHEKNNLSPLLDELHILSKSVVKGIEHSITKEDLNQIEEDLKNFNENISEIAKALQVLTKLIDSRTKDAISKANTGIEISKKHTAMLESIFEAITNKGLAGKADQSLLDKFNGFRQSKL